MPEIITRPWDHNTLPAFFLLHDFLQQVNRLVIGQVLFAEHDQLAGSLPHYLLSLKSLKQFVQQFGRLGHAAAFGSALFVEIDQQAFQRGVVEFED